MYFLYITQEIANLLEATEFITSQIAARGVLPCGNSMQQGEFISEKKKKSSREHPMFAEGQMCLWLVKGHGQAWVIRK